jgi:hypothetical protein
MIDPGLTVDKAAALDCALQARNGGLAPTFSALPYVRQRTDMF